MNQSIFVTVLSLLATFSIANAAAPTADNYRGVVQGIMAKFDRDYQSLNPEGQPDPGALGILEIFLQAMDDLGINRPTQVHSFFFGNRVVQSCDPANPDCQEMKIELRNSQHPEATLFGASEAFQYDVIVWSKSGGSDYSRILEGFYSQVPGTIGKGNMMVVACSGCSTPGHDQIEWDGTGVTYRLYSHMYDTKMADQFPQPYAGIIVNATYNPANGDMKLAIAGNKVCDSGGVGDSICAPNGTNDRTTGYSAILHANTNSGNVWVSGLQGANNSAVAVSGADPMCILADHSADLSGAACMADGIDNFTGITTFAPADAPGSFLASGSPWPMAEITDTPTF